MTAVRRPSAAECHLSDCAASLTWWTALTAIAIALIVWAWLPLAGAVLAAVFISGKCMGWAGDVSDRAYHVARLKVTRQELS